MPILMKLQKIGQKNVIVSNSKKYIQCFTPPLESTVHLVKSRPLLRFNYPLDGIGLTLHVPALLLTMHHLTTPSLSHLKQKIISRSSLYRWAEVQ